MINKKTELLAPAGTYEAVVSAINAGADAIYLGGDDFNARNSNKNFSNEEIEDIVKLASLYGVRINLAVNTLIKDVEYSRLIAFLDNMYKAGVYAFIVQDISLLKLIKERYEGVRVHASTQLSAHSMLDVLNLSMLGFDRVVLARECSFDEIKAIKESTNVELEVFIHGALCVSYSGQCLMSSLIGGRSGNRGLCAQPCRKPFALVDTTINKSVMDGYLLSPKDISQIDNVDRLIEIGIDSLKIEGRMKSPMYVYQSVKSYREKIDSLNSNFEFDLKANRKKLLSVFNRGGDHSEGYFDIHSSADMMSIHTPKSSGTFLGVVTDYNKVSGKCVIKLQDDLVCGDGIEIWTKNKNHVGTNINKEGKYGQSYLLNIKGEINNGDKVYKSYDKALIDEIKPNFAKLTRKNNADATFECIVGKPFTFSVTCEGVTITKQTEVVSENTEMPLKKEVIMEKLSKSGNTPFSINFVDFKLDDTAFIQLKSINELKRDVLAELEEAIRKGTNRDSVREFTYKNEIDNIELEKEFIVYLEDLAKLDDIIDLEFERLYIPFDNGLKTKLPEILAKCEEYGKDVYIKLPTITSTDTEILIDNDIEELKELGINGFVVSNYGQMLMCQGTDIVLDYNFNIINKNSIEYLQSLEDTKSVTISMEATLDEILEMENYNTEVLIHGRQVAMETRACPIGMYVSDKNEGKYCARRNKTENYILRDSMNVDFPIVTNCTTCICKIYNSNILFMMDKYNDLKKLKSSLRINISTEENAREIINGYINSIRYDNTDVYDIKDGFGKTITKGHFYRGVL